MTTGHDASYRCLRDGLTDDDDSLTVLTGYEPNSACRAASVEHLFALVDQRIHNEVEALDDTEVLRHAVSQLLETREAETAALAVPLLVHGIEAGEPDPAVTVAAAHHLWWLAAHVMDDVIDGGDLEYGGRITSGEAVMAAVVCASTMPVNMLTLDYPDIDLAVGVHEFLRAWAVSNDGQIRDLRNLPRTTSSSAVLQTYRHKNGAAYGMACGLAARISEVRPHHIDQWRAFGYTLGAMGQFRNDQEDLISGRDEDLRNQTATYLLVQLLHGGEGSQESARWYELIQQAPSSSEAVMELKEAMLAPERVEAYLGTIAGLHAEAVQALDQLGVTGRYGDDLLQLVDAAAQPLPLFAQVAIP